MRNHFVKKLVELAEINPDIWLLTADLGFSALEPFIEQFPERYINMGVAEQNMAGVAAGLALSGKTVFIYSIANFPSLRCLEQIRNDICYHNVNVNIVSVGAGYSYSSQGYTHHGIEDLAILRHLPNITIASPCDPYETMSVTEKISNIKGPSYLRLAKTGEPCLYKSLPKLEVGQPAILQEGEDVLLITTGGIAVEALKTAEMLKDIDISATVWSMPFIKPITLSPLYDTMEKYKVILTIEEGCRSGGLGTAIAEFMDDNNININKIVRLGIPDDAILTTAVTQEKARSEYGLDADSIIAIIMKTLNIDV